MAFREFINHKFQFLVEDYFDIVSFILCWGMNVQNNDMKPATSYLHAITNKLNPLCC
jgi:hypothetical protein